MSDWPASNAYTIAVQNPQVCFRDPDLKGATVERTAVTRMPKVWTGNFAQVYELKSATGRWAVKCFTRSAPDIRARYSQIAAAISRSRLPYFVDFDFLDGEMLVNGARYPVVKMRWVDGQRLDRFVQVNLYRPRALLATAAGLLALVKDLEHRHIAHGDLQHGNIVLVESGIKLIDYDGMFVPAFAGDDAPEAGLACYQHPRRSAADYGVGLDRFSVLVICTALSALAVDPSLWAEFSSGENLLFAGDDFLDPPASRLFERLSALADPHVTALVATVMSACALGALTVPLPDRPISQNPTPRHGYWWLRASTDVQGSPPPEEPARESLRVRVARFVRSHPLPALRSRGRVRGFLRRTYRIRVRLRTRTT